MDFINIIIFIALLLLGYIFGRLAEKRHFKSIFDREKQLKTLLIFPEKHLPTFKTPVSTQLVSGNVVVSVDYFKQFIAGLRSLVGGRFTSYESLFERARREAILRMKEEAWRLNASTIFNVKLETASISKGAKNKVGCVEVYAYGTALIMNPE